MFDQQILYTSKIFSVPGAVYWPIDEEIYFLKASTVPKSGK